MQRAIKLVLRKQRSMTELELFCHAEIPRTQLQSAYVACPLTLSKRKKTAMFYKPLSSPKKSKNKRSQRAKRAMRVPDEISEAEFISLDPGDTKYFSKVRLFLTSFRRNKLNWETDHFESDSERIDMR